MKKSRNILLPIAIVIVSVAIFAALVGSRPAAKTKEVKEQEWLVNAEQASLRTSRPTLVLFGRIESRNQSILTTSLEADVMEIAVGEGSSVKKGEILVRLQDREARLRLDQRKSEVEEISASIDSEKQRYLTDQSLLRHEQELLKLTKDAVDRMRSLKEQNLGSQSQLDEMLQARVRQSLAVTNREQAISDHGNRMSQLKARLEQANSRLRLAQIDLQQTTIKAPFNGSISSIKIDVGERVRPGAALLEIIQNDNLEVRTQIPSKQMRLVKKAIELRTATALSLIDGKPYELKLVRLSSKIEQGKGVVDAFLSINNIDKTLQDGRMIEVMLDLPPMDNVIPIPREALYGIDQVYKIEDSRLRAVKVEVIGEKRVLNEPGKFLIRSADIKQGDTLLVTKFANAIDGLRVKVQSSAI